MSGFACLWFFIIITIFFFFQALFYSLLRARTRRVISSQDEDAAFAQRLQREEFLQVYRGEARSSQVSISYWVVSNTYILFVFACFILVSLPCF